MTGAQIVAAIAARHSLTVADITGQCRRKPFVRARQEAYAALRAHGWSYPRIARAIGGRDHTTVMHGVRKHEGAQA
jgi:chromosomal replication initiator protein